MFLIHKENFWILIDGSFDVLTGTPHWRAYQNRLLGPIILRLLLPFGKYYEHTTALIFVLGFIILNNFLFYYFLNKISSIKNTALYFLVFFNFLFLVSQDVWLFAWDFIEITFFIIYGYVIITKDFLKFIPFLTLFHIFNRESSLLMIVFFIFYFLKNYSKDNLISILFLIFNFFFGIVYMIFIRNFLFKQQGDYLDGGQDLENTFLGGNWINITKNFNYLILDNSISKFFILFTLLLLSLYLFRNYKIFDSKERYLSLVIAIQTLPIFIFGIFIETRLYFPTIVILIYLIYIRKLDKLNKK